MGLSKNQRSKQRGYTLHELLVLVIVIGIAGTITLKLIANSRSAVKHTALASDVHRLNQAVKVFLANGGSLEGANDTATVLERLKTSSNTADRRKVVGLRGAVIDPRLEAIDAHHGEFRWRAQWKASAKRFRLVQSRDGASAFHTNSSLGRTDFGTSQRHTSMDYASNDGWVWEHSDRAYQDGETEEDGSLDFIVGSTNGGHVNHNYGLLTPVISPDSGSYDIIDFPLTVSIDNPNAVASQIYFSLSGNSWIAYTGPFSVDPGTTVRAYIHQSSDSSIRGSSGNLVGRG